MPLLPQVVPPIPQVENYNLQVLQRAMTPLPQANATFQQLLGLQPQQPYFYYYNTQPSQVYLFSKLLKIDVSMDMPFTCINFWIYNVCSSGSVVLPNLDWPASKV
jgi:hypothetical protein